jgi:hypothetical protein
VLTSIACQIGPGDVVVVQAAAGATGGGVVELAAAAGAEVTAVTSSAGKARGPSRWVPAMALPCNRCPARWRPCCPSPAGGAWIWSMTSAAGYLCDEP